VYALIYNARQKLGIDVQAIPEMYQQPPPRSKISLKAWARLSPTEKMVAYSTLTKPAKSDHVLQREIGRSDVKTARANARVKLAHPITKVRTKTLPSNATDIVIPEECKRPPAGYEHLAKKWKKLTPRQMMVLYRTLEGKEHAAIAQECDISESTMRQHRQRAMDIVQPTVSTSPDPDLIPEKRWKTLTLNEQKVARARIEDPTIPGTKMAELTGLTNGGITVVVRRLQETLGIDLSRKVLHKDHPSPPPGSGITQEQWNQLKPRHIKVAWVSLAHPDMKPADIAESLGIQKSSRREAGQFVSDLRLQIGRILGTPLHIERSTDPPEAAVE
jgi:DNA-binding CsgD family transcriptional regulator